MQPSPKGEADCNDKMQEQRVLFHRGEQRKFLNLVVERLNCISLRGILQFGFDMPYSTLKNYYVERRLISRSFFESLCHMAKIDASKLSVNYVNGNFGQIKGGKRSRR
jgi:hypothetical protein